MWFDLTKKVSLNKRDLKSYKVLQTSLYGLSFLTAAYLISMILFPSQFFEFSFNNSSAKSNTLTAVNINDSGKLKNGAVAVGENLSFTASSPSFFSKAVIQFELDKKSKATDMDTSKVSVRKAYRSFFYPDADPTEIENYIQARSSQIFGDGSLASYGDSIYVISDGQAMPIDSPETFIALGYDWKNVMPIDADQFAIYTKGSLLTLYSAHPNGTVFQTDTDKKYIVKDAKKYLLPADFTTIAAVRVSEKSFEIAAGCQLQKNWLTLRKYDCSLPLDQLQNMPGKDYMFDSKFSNDIQLQAINVELKRDMTFSNFNLSLNNLLKRSKENYVPTN